MAQHLKVLVLTGDGINCEKETANAFSRVGFKSEIKHINDLIADSFSQDDLQKQYSVLALPGGFSYGDDISSGKVLALKLKHKLSWDLSGYAKKGGLVIGICNGFQALIRLQVFGKSISLTHNESGQFINKWVKLKPFSQQCVWLKGLGDFELPVRHGEGRIVFDERGKLETLDKYTKQGRLCLKYVNNPNGSAESIAGICDSTGRIFGLMPHPEAFVRWTAHPDWTAQPDRVGSPGDGLALFENAFRAASEVRS